MDAVIYRKALNEADLCIRSVKKKKNTQILCSFLNASCHMCYSYLKVNTWNQQGTGLKIGTSGRAFAVTVTAIEWGPNSPDSLGPGTDLNNASSSPSQRKATGVDMVPISGQRRAGKGANAHRNTAVTIMWVTVGAGPRH